MGHSKNHGRRGLSLPLQLRAKMTGLAMFIGAFPSRSGRSLFDWKNKRGSEESAYGTAAEIAVSPGSSPTRCKRRDSGDPLSHPLPLAPLIEHCRARLNGDMPSGVAPNRFRAVRRMGLGCAMFSRFPSPVPVWADARPAPERFARLRRLSLNLCFCRPCPSPARAALSYRVRVWAFSAIRG